MKTRLFLSALLAHCCVLVASAIEVVVDDLHYEVDAQTQTASVISDTGLEIVGDWSEFYEEKMPSTYSGDVVIPATITVDGIDYRVTSINDCAFYHCSNLTSVNILADVTCIGYNAFEQCPKLTSVVIPETVTEIRNNAFYGCGNLASIDIPESVIFLGTDVFYGNAWIRNQPDGEIYAGRVLYCYKGTMPANTHIAIKEGTTQICNSAFENCSELTAVYIPQSVTIIGERAFQKCNALTECTLPPNLSVIQEWTFAYCTNLTSIIFPINLKEIRNNAFTQCNNVIDVYCPADSLPVTRIAAFTGMSYKQATLYVPQSSLEAYRNTSPWSLFGAFVPLGSYETEQCASPTIAYQEGKLIFTSQTKGAVCVTDITDNDITRHYGSEIPLSVTYTIRAVAKCIGYKDSAPTVATLCWVDATPTGEEEITVQTKEIKAVPVLVQRQGRMIRIAGASAGTPVSTYDLSGRLLDSTTASEGETVLSINNESQQPIILKIGKQTIKMMP